MTCSRGRATFYASSSGRGPSKSSNKKAQSTCRPRGVGLGAGRRGATGVVAAPVGVSGGVAEALPQAPQNGAKVEVLSARQLGLGIARRGTAVRDGLDAWLPTGEVSKACSFEYRLTVRAASITITPVLAGTRSAVPIADALAARLTKFP